MTATAFLELKQRATKLSEKERRNLSAFLIRLGQERAGWKLETARRLNAMAAGKNASVAELEELFAETKLSRILIIDNDINQTLGYVHHQQLFKGPKSIRDLILDISFVPEVMRVADLMQKFMAEGVSIACVVDEFGSVSGLITLEDIIEEIFGEIDDEYDEEEYVEEQIDAQTYRFSGRLEIDYLNDKFNLNFPEGEYHTLSGYLVTTTGLIPTQDDVIELNGYRFIIESVSATRIQTIRVELG